MPEAIEKHVAASFAETYRIALQLYLANSRDEELRKHAYDLGRTALLMNLGVLDLVEIHYRAEQKILGLALPQQAAGLIEQSMLFLEESLAPYEIVHQSYWDLLDQDGADQNGSPEIR